MTVHTAGRVARAEVLAARRAALTPPVVGLYRAGASTAAIRAELGISQYLALRILRDAGVSVRPAGYPAWSALDDAQRARKSRAIAAGKRGLPRPDVAERNRSERMRAVPRVKTPDGLRRMSEASIKHGHVSARLEGRYTATPTYQAWAAMIQRCTNPNNRKWPHYGGRGIEVCAEWRDFRRFLADMGERPDGLTLDRIDNDGNYEPGNVRWASWSVQNRNRRKWQRSPA